jgi:hypothetical protein
MRIGADPMFTAQTAMMQMTALIKKATTLSKVSDWKA